ncbi:MAG: sugar phosphate isomerase/epimerase [Clostridia bacterium]|nr:sugar phosphate isomerase/epimerase [Clostridia bacterium]
MRFGVCTGPENNENAAKAGFDYIECALNAIGEMEDAAFDALLAKVPSMPLPILKCNCFLPGWLKVTGPDVNEEKQRSYLDKALGRAKKLGVEVVVFGSGGARQVPEGFPMDEAWRQMAAFTRLAGDYAQKYGIRIALEPLRSQECNLLNLVAEANLLSSLINHPFVGVLGDSFHMAAGKECPCVLKNAGDKLWHIHISHHFSDLSGRDYPHPQDDGDYQPLIDALKAMNYQGDISIEGGTKDFEKDGPLAVARIKPFL